MTLRLTLIGLALVACHDETTSSITDTATHDTLAAADLAPDIAADTAPLDGRDDETLADVAMDAGVETVDAAVDTQVEVEVTPSCAERANPFVYDGAGLGDWNDLDRSPPIAQVDPPNHRGQDVIVKVGEPQLLVAKFAYGLFDQDMKEENVAVYMQREVPCGDWEHVGDFETSDDGQYGTQYGIEDDGGRVFFEIPELARFPVGRYPIRMVLTGDGTIASFDLIVVEPGTQAIVTDIDGTLTTGDEEFLLEIIEDVFNMTYVPQAYPDAVTMMNAYAAKGYLIVYATGRPDFLRPMTERWVEPRFPPGSLHLTDTNGQAVPSEHGVGTYKTEYLDGLKDQGLDFVLAYGNATTDIYAYANAGIPKDRTFIIGAHRGEEGTRPIIDSYTPHLPYVDAFPAATTPAPPAHGWW